MKSAARVLTPPWMLVCAVPTGALMLSGYGWLGDFPLLFVAVAVSAWLASVLTARIRVYDLAEEDRKQEQRIWLLLGGVVGACHIALFTWCSYSYLGSERKLVPLWTEGRAKRMIEEHGDSRTRAVEVGGDHFELAINENPFPIWITLAAGLSTTGGLAWSSAFLIALLVGRAPEYRFHVAPGRDTDLPTRHDVFLSYSRQDVLTARALARQFEEDGLCVFLDATVLLPGSDFSEKIEAELETAGSVVVLWSPKSRASVWVRAEAELARQLGALVPARIKPCRIPLPFSMLQTADLVTWKPAQKEHAGYQALLRGIREKKKSGSG